MLINMKTMVMKLINKDLIKAFIQECKWNQYCEAKFKEDHIEFDSYFKYSGRTEENRILISHWKYDHNHNCNDIHEQFIKTQDYEKIWKEDKNHSGEFDKELKAYDRPKAANGIWYDKI